MIVALASSFTLGSYLETTTKNDLAFLHTNCPAISAIEYDDLGDHITADRSIDGTLYIFNQIRGKNSPDDFEAGFRSIASEVLCLPGLGCAIPPHISNECGGRIQ
ncbi:hypothetical protein [Roseovarius nubinhibens]|uniref:hypothetical protein n=1 Tax=Roseovarius nubinhibens TaxID=314263 RepID=UPI001C302793|nr:hypothetical protein [Roseovarius nubinhibens]